MLTLSAACRSRKHPRRKHSRPFRRLPGHNTETSVMMTRCVVVQPRCIQLEDSCAHPRSQVRRSLGLVAAAILVLLSSTVGAVHSPLQVMFGRLCRLCRIAVAATLCPTRPQPQPQPRPQPQPQPHPYSQQQPQQQPQPCILLSSYRGCFAPI